MPAKDDAVVSLSPDPLPLTPLPGTLLVWGPRAARLAVLNEAEAGAKTGELCRRHGMSEATFYKWKAKYAGLTLNELKRLRSLEEENRRLKQIVAQQALDNWSLKELLAKNF